MAGFSRFGWRVVAEAITIGNGKSTAAKLRRAKELILDFTDPTHTDVHADSTSGLGAPIQPVRVTIEDDDPAPVKRRRRKSTSHLKLVPETLEHRENLRLEAERFAKRLDTSKPFSRNELETHGRAFL
ncbi:MAG: hypothetical protein KDA66_19520, partial [Planctomycetaceae bacterium]|nr:hypothetical protein [Planctomycetaceae bacterium]